MPDLRSVVKNFEKTIQQNEASGGVSSNMFLSNVAMSRMANPRRRMSISCSNNTAPIRSRANRRASLVTTFPAERSRQTSSGTVTTADMTIDEQPVEGDDADADDGFGEILSLAANRRFFLPCVLREDEEDSTDPFNIDLRKTDSDGFPMFAVMKPSISSSKLRRQGSSPSSGGMRKSSSHSDDKDTSSKPRRRSDKDGSKEELFAGSSSRHGASCVSLKSRSQTSRSTTPPDDDVSPSRLNASSHRGAKPKSSASNKDVSKSRSSRSSGDKERRSSSEKEHRRSKSTNHTIRRPIIGNDERKASTSEFRKSSSQNRSSSRHMSDVERLP